MQKWVNISPSHLGQSGACIYTLNLVTLRVQSCDYAERFPVCAPFLPKSSNSL